MVSEDRSFLKTIIFPWLGRAKDRTNILFAGTALYTALYPRHFPGHHFHTIDMMRSNRLYGAPGRHVVDVAREM